MSANLPVFLSFRSFPQLKDQIPHESAGDQKDCGLVGNHGLFPHRAHCPFCRTVPAGQLANTTGTCVCNRHVVSAHVFQ